MSRRDIYGRQRLPVSFRQQVREDGVMTTMFRALEAMWIGLHGEPLIRAARRFDA